MESLQLLYLIIQTLLRVLDELEALKPTFQRQVNELEKRQVTAQVYQLEGPEMTPTVSSRNSLGQPLLDNKTSSGYENKWVRHFPCLSF